MRPIVFISHPGEAAVYATQAKEVFESYGFTGWVFAQDRAARGDLDEDVAAAVQRCDYFAHICADGTAASEGQRDERRYAKACGKFPPVLLVFDEAHVPLVYARLYFDRVSPEAFVADCRRAVERLLREPSLKPATEADEGVPIAVNLEATLDFGLSAVTHVKKELGEAIEHA